MPSKEPIQSYISIKQHFSEAFIDFVDWIWAAVEKRVENFDIQDQLILEIVSSNTNEACRKVILSLPPTPTPTLDQLIEECAKKAMITVEDTSRKPAMREWILTPAAVTQGNQPPRKRCFHCHQEGHFISQCPFIGRHHQIGEGQGQGKGKLPSLQKNLSVERPALR